MRRSLQSDPSLTPPQPSTTPLSFTTTTTTNNNNNNTLTVPTPYPYPTLTTNTTTATHRSRSPVRAGPNEIADDIDDDLFGSAAWKKRRGAKRGGGKKTGSGRDNGAGSDVTTMRTDRWAWLTFVEKHLAKNVKTQALAVRKWCEDICRGIIGGGSGGRAALTTHDLESKSLAGAGSLASEGGRRKSSSAVPTASRGSTLDGTTVKRERELTKETLVEETKLLTENYIFHRLNSKGLMTKRVSVATVARSSIADDLNAAGQELERLYPRVYTDVSRRISMTMTSAQIVRRALTSVLENIFRSGVTWARLVAMVAISAAFAEECVVQGHPNFVQDVVMCVGHFVATRLSDWLMKQGGWDSFPTSRPPAVKEDPPDGSGSVLILAGLLLVAAICIFLLLQCVLSLGVT
ncbi:uncharacterized protein LOC143275413 [Babylonia areolata]|uniref:uncharacterized protein LOC143275413 n=1 Tax=Babylonia areolata TaxID=304850 RepID=UPI003FD34C53